MFNRWTITRCFLSVCLSGIFNECNKLALVLQVELDITLALSNLKVKLLQLLNSHCPMYYVGICTSLSLKTCAKICSGQLWSNFKVKLFWLTNSESTKCMSPLNSIFFGNMPHVHMGPTISIDHEEGPTTSPSHTVLIFNEHAAGRSYSTSRGGCLLLCVCHTCS